MPYSNIPPKYGAKVQYADQPDESPLLDKDGKTFIQQVNATFLYLGRAVDTTILNAFSTLISQQAVPIEKTNRKAKQLVDYVVINEEAILTSRVSTTILVVHSDASYLSKCQAKRRVGGIYVYQETT